MLQEKTIGPINIGNPNEFTVKDAASPLLGYRGQDLKIGSMGRSLPFLEVFLGRLGSSTGTYIEYRVQQANRDLELRVNACGPWAPI